MRSLRLPSRWGRPSTLSAAAVNSRIGVPPPSLRHAPDALLPRLLFWLLAASPADAAPAPGRLPQVRDAFVAELAGIDGDDCIGLTLRIRGARTLRELWHLRAELYRVVALHDSQHEAERRLQALNRHFPDRTPQPAFALR